MTVSLRKEFMEKFAKHNQLYGHGLKSESIRGMVNKIQME